MGYALDTGNSTLRFDGDDVTDYSYIEIADIPTGEDVLSSNVTDTVSIYWTADAIYKQWDNSRSLSYTPHSWINAAFTAAFFSELLGDNFIAFIIDENSAICGYKLAIGEILNDVYKKDKERWESPFVFSSGNKSFAEYAEQWLTFYNKLMTNSAASEFFFFDMNINTLLVNENGIYPLHLELVFPNSNPRINSINHVAYSAAILAVKDSGTWGELTSEDR